MQPTISIIMPVKNGADFIAESIHSVQAQYWTDWELLIVDDGSTDTTATIVLDLADADARIRYIKQEPSGVSAARNVGIDNSQGSLLTFLDSDDLWQPTFLDKTIACLRQEKVEFVFTTYCFLFADNQTQERSMVCPTSPCNVVEIFSRFFVYDINLLMGNFLFQKHLLTDEIRFREGCRYGEDTEFIYKLLVKAQCIGFIDESLFYYRSRSNSTMHAPWQWQQRVDAIRAIERAYLFFKEHSPRELLAVIEPQFFKYLNYMKYRFLYRMVKIRQYDDANRLLNEGSWRPALDYIIEHGKMQHRVKARLIVNCKSWAWRMVSLSAAVNRSSKK